MAITFARTSNAAEFQLLAALDHYEAVLAECEVTDLPHLEKLEGAFDRIRLYAAQVPELSVQFAELLIEHHRLKVDPSGGGATRTADRPISYVRLESVLEKVRVRCLNRLCNPGRPARRHRGPVRVS